MPSTLANIMDLLGDYKRVIKNNDDISIFYVLYQVMMMVGTILGPGSIFLMLAGALSMAFGLSNGNAFLANLIPLFIFILICLFCKPDLQITVAQVLSVAYALVMMAVLIGILIQIVEDGWFAPTTLSLLFVTFCFVFAAVLHPQEFGCLPMGFIYYITIPSMYLFLVIYSVFNLNVVSWGTREVAEKKTAEEMEEDEKKAEEAAKAPPKQKSGFMAWLTGADSKLAVWRMFGDKGGLHAQLKEVNEKLDNIENALKVEGYTAVQQPEDARRERSNMYEATGANGDSEVSKLRRGRPTVRITEPEPEKRDDMKNPKWIEEEDLGDGPKKALPEKELHFWHDLIEKYLKPLDKDPAKEKQVAAGLVELKNQMVFSFLMINSIWVITIFLMQENKDILYVEWPWGAKGPNISFADTDNVINLEYEYLQLEPIGLLFVVFFAVVLFIQLVGMVSHRIMTLGHIVSTTSIWKSLKKWFGKANGDTLDGNAIIDEHGVDLVKRWQKSAYAVSTR
jgi:chitin synthase